MVYFNQYLKTTTKIPSCRLTKKYQCKITYLGSSYERNKHFEQDFQWKGEKKRGLPSRLQGLVVGKNTKAVESLKKPPYLLAPQYWQFRSYARGLNQHDIKNKRRNKNKNNWFLLYPKLQLFPNVVFNTPLRHNGVVLCAAKMGFRVQSSTPGVLTGCVVLPLIIHHVDNSFMSSVYQEAEKKNISAHVNLLLLFFPELQKQKEENYFFTKKKEKIVRLSSLYINHYLKIQIEALGS